MAKTESSRAALIATLEQHLTAGLAKGGPGTPPIAPGARITENGVPAAAYEGLWTSARALPFHQTFADPETGQVGCHGSVDEGEWQAAFCVRLRVERGEITEVERLVARRGEASAMAPHRMKREPAFDASVATTSTRADLIAAADRYFDAVQVADGSIAPVTDACNRVENGLLCTNNPEIGFNATCRQGLAALTYIKKVRDRRYPLVDVALGLVWGFATFDVPPGGVSRRRINGETIERPQVPRSIHVAELFKVENGMISAIDVIVRNGEVGANLGW